MTNTDPEVQYWDSCMFISMLTGADPARVAIIRELIEQEKKGFIKIVVSTFVMAEVRPVESQRASNPAHFTMATELLESERLDFRPLTPSIAAKAQEIGMTFNQLTPADCVHIATAISAKSAVLFTFDGCGPKRRKPSVMIAHTGKIGNPALKICEPFVYRGPLFTNPGP